MKPQKGKIFKSLDKEFIEKVFRKNLKTYFPSFKKEEIKQIEIKKISPDWAEKTCLVRYKVFLNKGRMKIIRGSSNRSRSKEKSWKIMSYLYNHGFDQGNFLVSRPLDFIKSANLLLYEEAPGQPLAQIIEKGNRKEIKGKLKRIAGWLVKLHKIPVHKNKIHKASFIGLEGYLALLKKIIHFMPELKEQISSLPSLDFVEEIWLKDKRLIHDDFYPGNIIIDKDKVRVIDFDKSGTGPCLMDVATLYGAFDFPKTVWERFNLSEKDIIEFQDFFLKVYCKESKTSYQESKKSLRLFLAKIFLDQIHYFSSFAMEGWKSTDKQFHDNFSLKVKSLLLKLNNILN